MVLSELKSNLPTCDRMDDSELTLSPLPCSSQQETSVSSSQSVRHPREKSSLHAFQRRKSLSLSKKRFSPENGIVKKHRNRLHSLPAPQRGHPMNGRKIVKSDALLNSDSMHSSYPAHDSPSCHSKPRRRRETVTSNDDSIDIDFLSSPYPLSSQKCNSLASENLSQEFNNTKEESDTGYEGVENGEGAVVNIHERYQMAFLDERGDIFIPHCCKTMDVEYALPCPDVAQFMKSLKNDSRELLESTPYLFLPQSQSVEELEKFIVRSFAGISKQIKRCAALQLRKNQTEDSNLEGIEEEFDDSCDDKSNSVPPSISSRTKSDILSESNAKPTARRGRPPKVVSLPLEVQWKQCDAAITALRRDTFNMLMRILPDMDVSSYFDCNTCHVDQMVDCIIDSLYHSAGPTINNTLARLTLANSQPEQRQLVVSLCANPQMCLDHLRQRVLTLVTLICPFLEVPPSFSLERDLITLLKHVQSQLT